MICRKQNFIFKLLASCWFFSSTAFATNTNTYICIEQKAVGWEAREGGKEVYGKFNPSEERFFIKYYPFVFDPEGNIKELPRIEVTQKGKTYNYTYSGCDTLFRKYFTGTFGATKEKTINRCKESSDEQFGELGIHYDFIPRLSGSPRSTVFRYTQIVLENHSYLDQGNCVLSD